MQNERLRKSSKTTRNCSARKKTNERKKHIKRISTTQNCYYLYDLLIPLHFHLQNNKFFPANVFHLVWFGLVWFKCAVFLHQSKTKIMFRSLCLRCWVFVSSFVVSLMGIILMRLYDLCAEAIFDEMMNVERNANKQNVLNDGHFTCAFKPFPLSFLCL